MYYLGSSGFLACLFFLVRPFRYGGRVSIAMAYLGGWVMVPIELMLAGWFE
jgi:hypothetical protein